MTIETADSAVPTADDKVVCRIDNVEVHIIQNHIKNNHSPEWSVERYRQEFPDAPLLSPYAEYLVKRREQEKKQTQVQNTPVEDAPNITASLAISHGAFHEVFDLGNVPAAMNSMGDPIQIDVLTGHDKEALDYLPEIDLDYVFNIDLTKKVVIGFQLNMPTYLWGFHGTGKTTVLQQAAARTKRPFMRVQHSLNMQESDVLGQWTVRDGSTQFQLGPLPTAMINGMTYCADEYDTAMPNVTTIYQPVLEGQPLIIKDAPPQFRKIVPHPNFRFCATGNTNGGGDETGLYQGTLIQNAANYSRFKITEEVRYMDRDIETSIVQARAKIRKPEAAKIVKFAKSIRESFEKGDLSMTISPRELISAAQLGRVYGGKWQVGLELAFANRLSRIDKQTVRNLLQRQFGDD